MSNISTVPGHKRDKKANSAGSGETIFCWTSYSVFLMLTIFLLGVSSYSGLIPSKYRYIVFIIVILIFFIAVIYWWISRKIRVLISILLFLLCIPLAIGSYSLVQMLKVANEINTASEKGYCANYEVLVQKDSKIQKKEDLKGNSVGYISQDLQEISTEKLISALKVQVKFSEQKDFMTGFKALKNSDLSGLLISEETHSAMVESAKDSFAQIRVFDKLKICGVKPSKIVLPKQADNLDSSRVFNIYISGIDTTGAINTVSRSDVNIIASVNLQTKKVLLTNTPRDTYLAIPGRGNNQLDKLTHAGIYGVQTSKAALSQFYNIPIKYDFRINFTSFLKLIDVVGGIDIYNEQSFTSLHDHFFFPKGNIHLDAAHALEYVRERYSFSRGDFQRGQNQIKVIQALIKKLTQPGNITRVPQIFSEMGASIQSNITLADISLWAANMADNSQEFSVEKQELTGRGQMGAPSYLMPGFRLYTMKPDPESKRQVEAKIKALLEGK